MPKTCTSEGCTRPVFGKGYCKAHQHLRPDFKASLIKKAREKKEAKKEKRVKLIELPKLVKQTQEVFNRYIRLRDAGKPCISCGGYHTLQAGHYIAVGQSSYLRFNENNAAGQCGGCNGPKYGNPIPYRIELRKRIGDLALEQLERDFLENKRHKWTRADLEGIKEKYLQKIQELENRGRNAA